MGHTFSVFDEEIHVPAWIDAPPGVLSDAEQRHLRAKHDAFVSHADLAPTVLDLLGVWDAPQIRPYRARMLGSSLLGRELTRRPLPMTNCAAVWSCAFENWGYMQDHMKLAARSWNAGWECYDVAADPEESVNLGARACGPLLGHALRTFGRLPGAEKAKR
jgi:arylsulfatase A-like enzyme